MDRPLSIPALSIDKGSRSAVYADLPADAGRLLRALATLLPPESGVYRFQGVSLDFSDYRNLLDAKKKIGYITGDATVISNRTLRENLLLMRHYFENSLDIDMDEHAARLIDRFGIQDKLAFRPADLSLMEIRTAVTLRELLKRPDLILLEYPEFLFGQSEVELFFQSLKEMTGFDSALVFFSTDVELVRRHSSRLIRIEGGQVENADRAQARARANKP